MDRLLSKVAIVTGGGSWIGKGIAKRFSEEGSQVFLLGRDAKKLKHAVDEINAQGGEADFFIVDITQEKAVKKVVTDIHAACGRIDVLVQNAGIYPMSSLEDMTLQEWQHVIDVNLTGSFIMLKSVLSIMQAQHQGRVIFISSIAGETIGLANFAHYAASKAGINGLMRTAALELAKYNVTVNSIEPGNIFNAEAFKASKADIQEMLRTIPVSRLGTPEDVANLALFLASNESGFITGQNYVVDGGETVE